MPIAGLTTLLLLAAPMPQPGVRHPVLPVQVSAQAAEGYRAELAPVLAMEEKRLVSLVPTQSGLYFVGCPNCTEGRQEGQFADSGNLSQWKCWRIERPDEMRCRYCQHVYPSEKYPMTGRLEVKNPRGEIHTYPYWADAKGYRYHFAARIDYHKARYLESAANKLARVYATTGDRKCARRAALLLHRFAEVFPGYCYHFDFPFRQKVIFEGDVAPKDLLGNFRTARWTWWAYLDVPSLLIEAYDLIATSGELERLSRETGKDVPGEIRRFFILAVDGVLANREDFCNMSPVMWAQVIRAGRVLGRPDYIHTAVGRLDRLTTEQFFADGSWQEGAPSYHQQVVGALSNVFAAARGYSDPPGYTHPETGKRFDNLDIEASFPTVAAARRFLELMRLPNGRYVPIHDTWSTNGGRPLEESKPFLLPALGHACLGHGAGDAQVQAHLTWSPGHGHLHYDGLSLLLFAHGKELLSDLGYTHTRQHAATLATAMHNTVLIDARNQVAGRGARSTFGRLRFFEPRDASCQIVSVENPEVYPELAKRYQRTLALVAAEGSSGYLLDLFEVEGGEHHDYILHGSADEEQEMRAEMASQALTLAPMESLLPPGVQFTPARHEGEGTRELATPGYGYGYLGGLSHAPFTRPGICQVSYTLPDNPVRLRVHLAVSAGDELVLGHGPAVRGARENDAKLAECRRAFSLLRRPGPRSRFVSVIEPVKGTPAITGVRRAEIPGASEAIEIELAGGRRDLLLLDARNARGVWNGRPLAATAEWALLRSRGNAILGATLVQGSLSWGDLKMGSGPGSTHRLLTVDRAERSFLVEGHFRPDAGSVVTLDHAGKRISPYTVVSATEAGANTRLVVAEEPGFEWNAKTQTATFLFAPGGSFQGEHRIGQTPVARAPR